ncbi:MAG: hypothetical protein KTR20_07605 [Cellvibrionaceae bacterium]|nr:hypothetical protein [Cellvibrionaceae bacterium]
MDINDEKSCDQQQGKTPANSVTGCTVKYNDMSREVILNNAIVVACFRSSSFNCLFFEYLHLNQSRELSYKELEQRLFSGRIIQLNKMPDQMGFRGELKKALFTVTKNTIIYHPCKLDQYKKIRI